MDAGPMMDRHGQLGPNYVESHLNQSADAKTLNAHSSGLDTDRSMGVKL